MIVYSQLSNSIKPAFNSNRSGDLHQGLNVALSSSEILPCIHYFERFSGVVLLAHLFTWR